ncbi:M48 family metalloprotease [candidate division WWE3 bacterium]|nr:M48 family metalloprotease [candidate division WWE3 bacterium]
MATPYTHIAQNKRQTALVVVAFVLVISALGFFFDLYFGSEGFVYTGVALIFAGISSFISYYNSDKIVLAISGARKVTPNENEALHDLVENMAIASGLPKPEIYMIEDTAMNAFATGRDPDHSVICFTSGIVAALDKRELEGVIAHEMSHIGNRDILLMSVVSVLVGSITLLADWFTRGRSYRSRRRSKSSSMPPVVMALGLVLVLLSPVIAQLIKLALGRKREFLADSTAVMLTRYPQGLANALRKLSSDREILEAANGATAHLYITSPLQGRGSPTTWFSKLFSTHPPVEERIVRLESM